MKNTKSVACAAMLVLALLPQLCAGTISGTKSGTISGTRSGTISGTRSGTISGTRTGTISGTRSGIIPIEAQREVKFSLFELLMIGLPDLVEAGHFEELATHFESKIIQIEGICIRTHFNTVPGASPMPWKEYL